MHGAASQDNSDTHVARYSTLARFVERIGYGRRRAHVGAGREAPAIEHGDQTLRPLGRRDPEQGYIRAGEVSSRAGTLVLLHRAFLGNVQGVTHGLIQGHGSSLLPLFLPDGLLKTGARPVYARLDDCALL